MFSFNAVSFYKIFARAGEEIETLILLRDRASLELSKGKNKKLGLDIQNSKKMYI